jgi:hypothetical protein
MERYEVRLHKKTLGEFFDEVAAAAWSQVAAFAAAEVEGKEAVKEAVNGFLTHHLHRYDNCGKHVFCTECAVFKPLQMARDGDERTDPNLREDADIYQLFVHDGLNTMLETLASLSWWYVVRNQKADVRKPTSEERLRIREALRSALAPHVYYNTECGARWECQHAREVRLNLPSS